MLDFQWNARVISVLTLFCCITSFSAVAADEIIDQDVRIFSSTKIINTLSVETLPKNKADFIVTHRFGDLATDDAIHSFFGIDQSTDVFVGFEYGVTEDLTIGFGRNSGSAGFRELYSGAVKYKFLQQTEDGMPISLGVYANAVVSGMKKTPESPSALSSFEKPIHRFAYYTQVMIAHKIKERVSLQFAPGLVYRNLVLNGEDNAVPVLNFGGQFFLSKKFSLIVDYSLPISSALNDNPDAKHPLALSFNWETKGHNFQIDVANSAGILPNDYLVNTRSNWLDGEFRVGFTITRRFTVGKKHK